MTGRLDLGQNVSSQTITPEEMNAQGRFEELVEVVEFLHQLERDADEEQLLKLLYREILGAQENRCGRTECTKDDKDIEQVPTSAPVSWPQAKNADDDVRSVHQ